MVDVARPLLLHKVGSEVGRDAWSSWLVMWLGSGPGLGPGAGPGLKAKQS